MRHYRRERLPRGLFRGVERTRLITCIVLLVVLYVLMAEARNADRWRWLTGPPLAASQEPEQEPLDKLPPASGPTDEDAEQLDAAREEFQAITDGTPTLGPEEMEAYDRLVAWVKNQSFARLDRRATHGLRYTHLFDEAEARRGQLAAFDVDVLIAEDAGKNRDGVPLEAVWAATDESRGRLYSLIVVDYPPEMPTGYNIRAKAKFAGYFLKLQGYEPASAKPGQAPEKAPLLIGRLQRIPTPTIPSSAFGAREWWWGLGLVALVAAALGVRWIVQAAGRSKPASDAKIPEPASGEVVSIEQWLEQSDFGAGSEDDGTT